MDHEFHGIECVGRRGAGTFKISNTSLGWKQPKGDAVLQFSGKDTDSVEWQSPASGRGLLKIVFKGDGGISRFAGFDRKDLAKLATHFLKHFGVQITEVPMATNGWSWGDCELTGSALQLRMEGGKLGFEVPVAEIGQVSALGKTDVSLEFPDDSELAQDEVLHEMRLYVPGGEGELTAEALRDELLRLSDGLSRPGDALARVAEIALQAPRGKHDFEFFQHDMRLHGKTHAHTIKYKNIARIFQLQLPNGDIGCVLGLEQPLRQGQQSYSFVVMAFEPARMVSLSDLSEARLRALNRTAESEMPVDTFTLMHLKELSGKTIVQPSSAFKEMQESGLPYIKCSHKANPGSLYINKKSLLFIVKPVIWVRYDDIESVSLNLGVMRRTTFDLTIRVKGRSLLEFSQVERTIHTPLFEWFKMSKVTIENVEDVEAQQLEASSAAVTRSAVRSTRSRGTADDGMFDADEAEDDEDGDFEADDSDDDADAESDGSDDNAGSDEGKQAKKKRKKA